MAPHHFALMTLICLIWAFNTIVAKIGVAHFPPMLFTGLRFALLTVLLLPLLKIHHGRMREIVGIGLLAGGIHFGFIFTALTIVDASVAGIVTQLAVPFLTLLSIIFLGEVVRWRRWMGMGLSFIGVMVITFDPAIFTGWLGHALLICGALSMSGAMILMRKLKGVSPFQLQAWVAVISAPVLFLGSALMESGQQQAVLTATWFEWGLIVFMALAASLIGHAGIYYLLQRYEASLTGPLTLMAPLFTVLFGVWLLDEPITLRFLAGGALTLGGVLIIALRQAAKPTPESIAESQANIIK